MAGTTHDIAQLARTGTPIGVGIIGLSAVESWAGRAHVPALRAVEGFELRALAASSVRSAAESGRVHGVSRTFGTAAELSSCDEVDLVVVAVKVPHHRELVREVLGAGRAVLCEWPLGNGLAEAEELAALAREKDVPTVVGLQARSNPALAHLRDLVADGYVGTVLSTTVTGSGGPWGPELRSERQRYLLDSANGATMLTIPFAHTLDGVASVLGEPEIRAADLTTRVPEVLDVETGETVAMTAPDQVVMSGRLPSGAVVTFHYRGGTNRATNFRWEINGTEGDLVVTAPSGHLQMVPVTIEGGRGDDTALSVLPLPEGYARVPGLDPVTDAPAWAVAHAYDRLLQDLRDGTTTVPDFDHAVLRHRSVSALEKAAG